MRNNSEDKPGDKIRLLHIIDAINELESYLKGVTFENFLDNSMMKFACIKQLEIIGEASNHITDSTKQRFSEVEWKQITGLRNVLTHEYFGIDVNLVWQIMKTDIPLLKQKVEKIIQSY